MDGPPQHFDEELARVGSGTPCGELFRRYWQPIAEANKVTTRPQNVRILGEDLVLFRDRKGRAGLLYPRCMHRGTSLFYGKVEDEGIRCCYHGWLFGVDGQCLDQPCEPEHGLHRDKARQPWYPVEERYGLVFAYMGPPEKKPILPRYDILEDIGPDDTLVCGCSAPPNTTNQCQIAPYNWMPNDKHYGPVPCLGAPLDLHWPHSLRANSCSGREDGLFTWEGCLLFGRASIGTMVVL
jgi:nitrite reductase/ring-hydroxylating ferredoxin subunit